MDLFKKSTVIGVSVTPEIGLEVAEIDFASQTVIKYGTKQLEYDINRREIADLDLFKEAIQDLFFELQIPKGAKVVLNIPTVVFKTNDYPAALDETQISNAIEEDLSEHYIFNTVEPDISATKLPNSSMQFYKIAYTVAQKQMLIEIVLGLKDLGYDVTTIDTSVNSTLNALMYKQRVDVSSDMSWVLMIVDNMCCRIISMMGKNYVDSFEERISIGKVLDDAENYATVISAANPVLRNLPSKYLCVVSKTNIISAEILASKLTYSAPIIHQEANCFSKEAFLDIGRDVDEQYANIISLDVIGAAIHDDFLPYASANFNLFNESLGEVYESGQPPKIQIGDRTIVLSNSFLITLFILLALIIGIPATGTYMYYSNIVAKEQDHIGKLDRNIAQIQKFLDENKHLSSDLFNEGDEIRLGLIRNKNIFSYYEIVGTEIPKKLWLTHLKLSDKTTIEGQSDNLESVYAFYRSIKDYNIDSDVKLQKLGLASNSKKSQAIDTNLDYDTESILTSLNADFYEFSISNEKKPNSTAKKNNNLSGLELIN